MFPQVQGILSYPTISLMTKMMETIMPLLNRLRLRFLSYCNDSSLSQLLGIACVTRFVVWFVMATVCAVFPTHNPGDDVVRYDLRWTIPPSSMNESSSLSNAGSPAVCFAKVNAFCDCGYSCTWKSALAADESKSNHLCLEAAQNYDDYNLLQTHVFPFLLEPLTRWDAARFLRLAHEPQLWQPNHLSNESEMAHAFFPFFPALIQRMAAVLLYVLPRCCLPSTCEGVLVLAASLLNFVCFLVALASLHQTTLHLLLRHGVEERYCILWSNRVGLLFILNPALVFFTTSYSEALFAALVFAGSYFSETWHPALAIFPWTLATATRSNGILYFGYLLLSGTGRIVSPITDKHQSRILRLVLMCCGLFIFYPLYRHNQKAISAHCDDYFLTNKSHPQDHPWEWCERARTDPSFFLYSYIQSKHWNVGFLRYYQWKQIPNFLLAAPILFLSFIGVADWIRQSWNTFASADDKPWLGQVLPWAISSLGNFAFATKAKTASAPIDVLVGNPVLGHYAVWAVAALLGLTTAHVQISTRLLCSTCPALYWYAAHLLVQSERWGSVYLAYALLYIVLGAILHPLWLPWT